MKLFSFGKKKAYSIEQAAELIKKELDTKSEKSKIQMQEIEKKLKIELDNLGKIIDEFASKPTPEMAKRSENVKERFCSVAKKQLGGIPQDSIIPWASSLMNNIGGLTQRQMLHINIFFREDFAPIAKKMREIEGLLVTDTNDDYSRAYMLYQKVLSAESKSAELAGICEDLEKKKASAMERIESEKNRTHTEPSSERLDKAKRSVQEARQEIDSFLPVQKLLKKYAYAKQLKEPLIDGYIESPSSALLTDKDLEIINHINEALKIFSELSDVKKNSILNGREFLFRSRKSLEGAIDNFETESKAYSEEKDRYNRLISEKQRILMSLESELKDVARDIEEASKERKNSSNDAVKSRLEFCTLASKLLDGDVA